MDLRRLLPLLALLALPCIALAGGRPLLIGTAEKNGIFYPVGGAICRFVNENRVEHGMNCRVKLTDGSFENLQALRKGRLDLAVVQSDRQAQAYDGQMDFAADGPDHGLRSLFSLYVEPFTVVANPRSGIRDFGDLKGHRVDIGTPGSGMHSLFILLMQELGWRRADFAALTESSAEEQVQQFCDGKVDAVVYVAGVPNRVVQQLTSSCGGRLIGLDPSVTDKLLRNRPYYVRTVIPAHMYAGNPSATDTFGAVASVVTTASVPEKDIHAILQSLFEDFDSFKTLHPAFAALRPEQMVQLGLTAPLHEGARSYYRDKGWMN